MWDRCAPDNSQDEGAVRRTRRVDALVGKSSRIKSEFAILTNKTAELEGSYLVCEFTTCAWQRCRRSPCAASSFWRATVWKLYVLQATSNFIEVICNTGRQRPGPRIQLPRIQNPGSCISGTVLNESIMYRNDTLYAVFRG